MSPSSRCSPRARSGNERLSRARTMPSARATPPLSSIDRLLRATMHGLYSPRLPVLGVNGGANRGQHDGRTCPSVRKDRGQCLRGRLVGKARKLLKAAQSRTHSLRNHKRGTRMGTMIGSVIFAALALAAFDIPQSNSPAVGARARCHVCDPAQACPVEGDVCCPHRPGPDVPFTCAPPPCFRSSGELCSPGDECAIEGDVCCPHAPGPDVPFTCAPELCFR